MNQQVTNQNPVAEHANLEDLYELSPMQQGMLFHTLYSPGSGVYFEQSIFTIEGDFDPLAFQKAWQQVIARHSMLRTGFVWEGVEKPVQIVYRKVDTVIAEHDWREFDAEQQHGLLQEFIREDQVRGFELARPPLLRLTLFRIAENSYKLVWSRHHLILDRWSRAIVLKEVLTFYNLFRKGLEPEIEGARPYGDYIGWLLKQSQAAAESFWRRSLSGFENPTEIRLGHVPSAQPQTYDSQSARLSSEATSKLRKFSREQKLTMNTLVQGAWALLLSRYSGDNDVLFGATVAGRPAELSGVERMVGLFINTLPVRVKIPSQSLLFSWLRNLQEQQAEQRQYEYSSLIDIQSWSHVPRGVPLFETILVFENLPVETSFHESPSDLIIHADRGLGSKTSYPLTMIVNPGAELSIQAIYDCGRFDAESIRRLLRHFGLLLEQFTGAPQCSLHEISLLNPVERNQVLREWNQTSIEFVSEPVHKKFERQARETPHAIAVMNGSQKLTYDELNRRANQLARLLQRKGVCADECVALFLEPSTEMVIGLLAILKAGAAYLPIDPEFPTNRINFILADAGVKLTLTSETAVTALSAATEAISIDGQWQEISQLDSTQPETAVHLESLAYVIYTSGSTGNPKGVSMPHVTLANLLDWQQREYPLRPETRVLQFSAFTFDVSFQEIFSTWVGGGTLVLTTKDVRRDPFALWKFIQGEVIQRIFLPFVALQQLAQAAEVNPDLGTSLKEIFTAGEQLEMTPSIAALMRSLPAARLHNQYGPTESHVVTAFNVPAAESDRVRFPPIGCPIANTQIYLLDQQLAPVPAGISGELHIGGISLSRGYLQKPELTAERFVPNPFTDEPGSRLYRTGDIARYLPDGNIEFLGRRDNQVKIRGFRIETAEIESSLRQHPMMREAVVTVSDGNAGEKRLIAYLVLQSDQAITINELRTHLQQSLPDYMIPAAFVLLDALPLTSSGKVDRRQLPVPDEERPELGETYVAPRTPLEQEIASIWEQVLKVKGVGIYDNFFVLGGHSLLATQVISRMNESMQIEIPLRTVFELPTIAGLALAAAQFQARTVEAETNQLISELVQLSDAEAQQLLDSEILSQANQIAGPEIE